MTVLNKTGSALKIGFKVFRFAFKTTRIALFTLLLVASLALNATMLLWQTGALAVSGAIAGVTGITTVVSSLKTRNAKILANRAVLKNATKRVSRRVVLGTTRNIGSMAAESLPAIGTAVIVGVTALEVAEACATMQDMQEINSLLDIDGAADDNTTIDPTEVCGLTIPTTSEVWETVKNSPADAWNAVRGWEVDLPSWGSVQDEENGSADGTVDETQPAEESENSWWDRLRGN